MQHGYVTYMKADRIDCHRRQPACTHGDGACTEMTKTGEQEGIHTASAYRHSPSKEEATVGSPH